MRATPLENKVDTYTERICKTQWKDMQHVKIFIFLYLQNKRKSDYQRRNRISY